MIRPAFFRPATILLAACVVWGLLALCVWSPLVWPGYSPFIMNDGDTPLYASYAYNLAQCPFSVTHGLMTNSVGPTCLPLMAGEEVGYYLDHPPGAIWWMRLALPLFDSPEQAVRVVNMLFAVGIVLLCSLFAYSRRGLMAGLGVLAGSCLLPVLWWHSVSANLQTATSFFSVLGVIAFIRYDESRHRRWLVVSLLAMAMALACDWPAYFVLGPIGLYLLWQRRFALFALYFVLGVGMMVGTFVYFAGINLGLNMRFNITHFFTATFVAPFKPDRPSYLTDNSEALWQSVKYLRIIFSRLGVLLLLLPLLLLLRKGGRAALAPFGLFMACFAAQGLLNQVLFFQWAGSHNYWNFYYLPLVLVSAGFVLDWAWQKAAGVRWRQGLVIGLVGLALLSSADSIKDTMSSYYKQPRTIVQTLEQNGLLDVRDPAYTLLSPDASVHWGQGFKLRLDIPRQIVPLARAAEFSCDKTFTIYKNSTLTPEQKASRGGISIEEFDWYVIRGNPENPACR